MTITELDVKVGTDWDDNPKPGVRPNWFSNGPNPWYRGNGDDDISPNVEPILCILSINSVGIPNVLCIGTVKLSIYFPEFPIIFGVSVWGWRGVRIGPLYAVETVDIASKPTLVVCDATVSPPEDVSSCHRGDTILPLRSCIYWTQRVPPGVPICSHMVFHVNNL